MEDDTLSEEAYQISLDLESWIVKNAPLSLAGEMDLKIVIDRIEVLSDGINDQLDREKITRDELEHEYEAKINELEKENEELSENSDEGLKKELAHVSKLRDQLEEALDIANKSIGDRNNRIGLLEAQIIELQSELREAMKDALSPSW